MSRIESPQTTELLRGRKVLVTGAARGLGLEFARSIVQAGGAVVMADILADQVQAAAAELRDQGHEAHGLVVDLNDPDSIQACADSAVQAVGGLDGLVNNAAMTHSGGKNLEELDVDVWDDVMRINVRGTWLMSRACLPALRASQAPSIVNLASDTPMWGAPNLLAYVASKGAVMSMTRSMARELGADGITVNAVAPGLTLVEATAYVPQQRHELYENQRALQRAQLPDDVSGAVTFLLSGLSRFVTGQVLAVNGGFVMH
ncbi:MAG TPA: SDR family oxidoreductase [Pusillimonas sp.]|uniref:SDR family oxidoreductase n=1 Tax=unclassified Pusillimonas TaxID=2640016 RepID=UPI0026397373|nr:MULTISPECIES: SDR family oxidoreductase [unclassified Pusillimonas]HLU20452.1 SDR family oxidoreductase [Pusillimonas sp.]